jgi:AbrB family looped-hinge helix DNA binding protein
MRVTEKGQVTIPLGVRRHLGIAPGSEIEFELRDGEALLRRVEPGATETDAAVGELLEHLRRHKGSANLGGMSPDEFYRMLRD